MREALRYEYKCLLAYANHAYIMCINLPNYYIHHQFLRLSAPSNSMNNLPLCQVFDIFIEDFVRHPHALDNHDK